jgi:hypothetical protein
MQNVLKILITLVAAFSTVCGSCPVYAEGIASPSASASVLAQLQSTEQTDFEDTVDLVFDYIFALKEEKKTPSERINAILPLCRKDESNSVYRFGPVIAEHWLVALNDFKITDVDSLKLLDNALATIDEHPPQSLSENAAQNLLNWTRDAEKVATLNKEQQKTKVLLLTKLARIAQANKNCGREIGTIAVERLAEFNDTKLINSQVQNMISQIIASYTSEIPRGTSDGKLLFRDALAIAKLSAQTKNQYLVQLDNIYFDLFRRCSKTEALTAQKALVDAAKLSKVEEKTLHILLLQLACAYLRAGNSQQAEAVLTKQIKTLNPIDKLLLAACYRRQGKYAMANKICQLISLGQLSYQIQCPRAFIALADAIRAEVFIAKKNYWSALPLLIAADSWFGNAVSHENRDMHELLFFDNLVPDEISVLTNLALVYEKLGRKGDVVRINKILSNTKTQSYLARLSYEKEFLKNEVLVRQKPEKSQQQAIRMMEVLRVLEVDSDKRIKMLLDYAESLVRQGKTTSAEVCFETIEKEGAIKNDLKKQTKLLALRALSAEERADIPTATKLLKDLSSAKYFKSAETALIISEIETRLALLLTDYQLAELTSRPLETSLEAQSTLRSNDGQESKRDQFVNEHREAMLDRVCALNQLKNYKQAAKLARLILLTNIRYDRTGTDCAANLAYAYLNDGHKGLADAALCEAKFNDRARSVLSPSRYELDAKEKLASLYDQQNNPLRARRYRAEAKEIREQLDKNNSSQSSS